jgi:hypothetical protein
MFPDVLKECSAFIHRDQEVTQSYIPEDLKPHIIYPLHGTESCNPFRSKQQCEILNVYTKCTFVDSWDSVFGIATRNGPDGPVFEIRCWRCQEYTKIARTNAEFESTKKLAV